MEINTKINLIFAILAVVSALSITALILRGPKGIPGSPGKSIQGGQGVPGPPGPAGPQGPAGTMIVQCSPTSSGTNNCKGMIPGSLDVNGQLTSDTITASGQITADTITTSGQITSGGDITADNNIRAKNTFFVGTKSCALADLGTDYCPWTWKATSSGSNLSATNLLGTNSIRALGSGLFIGDMSAHTWSPSGDITTSGDINTSGDIKTTSGDLIVGSPSNKITSSPSSSSHIYNLEIGRGFSAKAASATFYDVVAQGVGGDGGTITASGDIKTTSGNMSAGRVSASGQITGDMLVSSRGTWQGVQSGGPGGGSCYLPTTC